jgi:hypothetical protein
MIEPVQTINARPEALSVSPDRTVEAVTPVVGRPKDRTQADAEEKDSATVEGSGPEQSPLTVTPDFRLVIEHNVERSVLVYRLVNRATGEVLSEVSRDDVVNYISDPAYRSGTVIDTKA